MTLCQRAAAASNAALRLAEMEERYTSWMLNPLPVDMVGAFVGLLVVPAIVGPLVAPAAAVGARVVGRSVLGRSVGDPVRLAVGYLVDPVQRNVCPALGAPLVAAVALFQVVKEVKGVEALPVPTREVESPEA